MISVGVKFTDNTWLEPVFNIVPADGVYANVPATLAVAFSCVADKGVPYTMGAGVFHVTVGVALVMVKVPLT